MALRSGFVSIIGRPNAGKSTLLNALLGQKLAIVTHKPQTTRTRIQGVLELPLRKKVKVGALRASPPGPMPSPALGPTSSSAPGLASGPVPDPGRPAAQVVLVDTPGVHKPTTQLDKRMMQEVHDALESRDVVLFLVDATHRLHEEPPRDATGEGSDRKVRSLGQQRRSLSRAEDDFALQLVQKLDCPVILVLNKMDVLPRSALLPLIAHWSALHTFADVIPISARRGENLELLLDRVVARLPEGRRYFPKDQLTDQPERFLVAELIREKILMLTGEEVPYATAVVVERYEEPASLKKGKDGKLPLTRITAAIYCERVGQKAILIGRAGEMLKRLGTAARKDIEALLGTRVFLELFVKVQEDWRASRGFVEDLDWRRQLEQIAEQQQRHSEPGATTHSGDLTEQGKESPAPAAGKGR